MVKPSPKLDPATDAVLPETSNVPARAIKDIEAAVRAARKLFGATEKGA
jgi:hypothetical protein